MGKRIQNLFKLKTVFLAMVVLLTVAAVILWLVHDGWFLDNWEQNEIACDLDGDGISEVVRVSDRKLTIHKKDELIFESDGKWKVCNFIVTDINNDGLYELLMLLWKRGSFEKYKPFWKEDDNSYSQHVFIYRLKENELKPVWKSSKLIPEIKSWKLLDTNRIYILTESGEDTVWTYGEWGLERIE